MKIHFCDLCNESVPQSDLDEGRAYLRKGRVICATCDRAMSQATAAALHGSEFQAGFTGEQAGVGAVATSAIDPGAEGEFHAPAPAPASALPSLASTAGPIHAERAPAAAAAPASGGSAGIWVGLVALVFAAGAVAILTERTRKLSESAARVEAEVRRQTEVLRGIERASSDLESAVAALEQRLGSRLDGERARVDGTLSDLRAQASTLAGEQRGLAQAVAALRDESGAGRLEIERKADALAQRMAKGEDEGRQIAQKIGEIEERSKLPPPGPASGGPSGPGVAAAGAGSDAPPAAPTWTALVHDLASAKAAARWEAVDQLGQSRDPQVVPYLLPMLKDSDVFVRMATARVLGDLVSLPAVPALIDALEDAEAAVREAALVALRTITNKDLRFDPLATEAERAKKVKAWRDWWKKEEEEGRAGKG